MSQLKTIDKANVEGKRVIVRVDWNVTIGKALQIVDDTRIRKTFPTIELLLNNKARQVTLLSHLGKAEEHRSIRTVVEYASRILGNQIRFWESIEECSADNKPGIKMLENVRFWEGEESNDPDFADKLAQMGEVYVDEAFGEAHREVASITGIPKLVPSFAGVWFAEEVKTITNVRDSAESPFVVVMGGAKVEDKSKLLEVLSQKADTILLGGKLANEFTKAGMKLGGKAKVVLPTEGSDLLDIGKETQMNFAEEISKAKTVVWNGPMGKVEDPKYRAGTEAVYEAITANVEAYTLVGGGDTLAAIGKEEHLNRIDHISTGGGAMLKLLEAGTLPGIKALEA